MMARFPAPMAGWSAIVPTVVDTIVKALGRRHAGSRAGRPSRAARRRRRVLRRASEDRQRRFVVQSIEGGGWGGRPSEDGESGTVSVCQGDVRNGSIEGIELKCPVLVESRGLRTDSGGAGKYRGGLGIDMQVRNLVEGRWNFEHTRREKCPPWGIVGRRARRLWRFSAAASRRKRFPLDGRKSLPGARGIRGHRAHRWRRRLGRSARSRRRRWCAATLSRNWCRAGSPRSITASC